MRKYIIGALFGMFLTLSASVYAEEIESVVGKMIEGEFPVVVGEKQLENKAIVVNGTSYLPVREFGESIGYEVLFNPEGKIVLNKKSTDTSSDQAREELSNKIYEVTQEISNLRKQEDEIQQKISDMYKLIEPYEKLGFYNGKMGYEKEPDEYYYETKKERDSLINQRDEIRKEIENLHQQVRELQEERQKLK